MIGLDQPTKGLRRPGLFQPVIAGPVPFVRNRILAGRIHPAAFLPVTRILLVRSAFAALRVILAKAALDAEYAARKLCPPCGDIVK